MCIIKTSGSLTESRKEKKIKENKKNPQLIPVGSFFDLPFQMLLVQHILIVDKLMIHIAIV